MWRHKDDLGRRYGLSDDKDGDLNFTYKCRDGTI